MKKANDFQIVKLQLSLNLTFCQYQPDFGYKSVAYKKSVYIGNTYHFKTKKTFYQNLFYQKTFNS